MSEERWACVAATAGEPVVAAMPGGSQGWKLGNIPFWAGDGEHGTMMLDTGAEVTCVSTSLVQKLGLQIAAHDGERRVRMAGGDPVSSPGTVTVEVTVQLMLDVGEDTEVWVHWDRRVRLEGAWVLPGDSPPRDIYVAYSDWDVGVRPHSPLASLAWMVMQGSRVLAGPRVPKEGKARVLLRSDPALATVAGTGAAAMTTTELRELIWQRFPSDKKEDPVAIAMVDIMVQKRRVFEPLDLTECTETVEMTVIGTPEPVSFRVPVRRGARGEAAEEGLRAWIDRGICEKVPWDTPAYGFVIVVPKPGGKWRVTINPAEVNACTKRVDPINGFMPESMVMEAQRAGRCRRVFQLDLTEAFLTMKLGPAAQRISTFTTPVGKLRWKHGYFGWHSFPAIFQRIIMEKVILPTWDDIPEAVLIAWIDDVIGGDDDDTRFLRAFGLVLDRIMSFGGRVQLQKCNFLHRVIDYCGVELNTETGCWRISPARVASLGATPVPTDRTALQHVLGILRYYYFGVADHKAQRERIAMLQELDVSGLVVQRHWTDAHTRAMRDAFAAVMKGEWIMVFRPNLPVWVATDASGKHGYCITAWQWDDTTGKMLPIGFWSAGWLSTQLLWTPQVKESYAQRQAVCSVMPKVFPHADIILLGDNKNLSREADSEDLRVRRWQHDINCAGCVKRWWVKGNWNTIADYGSRSVHADASATLSEEERFEMHLYALMEGGEGPGGTNPPVVPGHVSLAPLAAKIALAQQAAPGSERDSWRGTHHTTTVMGERTLHLWKGKLIVPRHATEIKQQLLRMAHEGSSHYMGSGRTLWALDAQAKVWWAGMTEDAAEYIRTCFKCKMAKAEHKKSDIGVLHPTLAPYIHHTWYTDLKGPLPHGTGYIMVIVEAISRFVKLRYLPDNTAKQVCEELGEAIASFGTRPVILRSDGGPPFNSSELEMFCELEGVRLVRGAPEHSEGQGKVETLIRQIASALIATLGHKAQHQWADGSLLTRLEGIINSTVCEPTGSSPYGVLMGREPRTALSARVHWEAPDFGAKVVGVDGATLNDVSEIVAQHHAAVAAAEQRAILASSVAQAITKRDWDAKRVPGNFKAGESVIVLYTPPNRLLPWWRGPYVITRVSVDGNFVHGYEVIDAERAERGPFHVARLKRIDLTRTTATEIAAHQCEAGSAVIATVLDHRHMPDGTYEFKVSWFGTDVTTWVKGPDVRTVARVLEYCQRVGLGLAGTAPAVAARRTGMAPSRMVARGRGRSLRGR